MKGNELEFPRIRPSRLNPDPGALTLLSRDVARKYQVLPVSVMGKVLTVVTAEPIDVTIFDDLKYLTGYQIRACLAGPEEVREAVEKWYRKEEKAFGNILSGSGEGLLEIIPVEPEDASAEAAQEEADLAGSEVRNEGYLKELVENAVKERIEFLVGGEEESAAETKPEHLAEQAEQAPIIRLVNHILLDAHRKRASDIHIEPYEKRFRLRYRIDGILYEEINIPRHLLQPLLARLKIISNLDITEKRLPQDGRFKMNLDGKEIDYRVSILPLSFGGKVVMRALGSSVGSLGLADLGFLPRQLEIFEETIHKPYGMILVTGPTGSGKSTTLSTVISALNTPNRNIMTIEDPVEYQIPGITQIPVNPEIGFTFAEGLRSLLRQSPDIIMVGEIRDSETADIAVKAALTGQLVLSTLHTNDAAGAINRLIDMGVEPFLVSSSVIMVSAQRLIRKICDSCRAETHVSRAVISKLGIEPSLPDRQTTFYAGRGCGKCHQTGYHGRIAITEILVMDEEIKELAAHCVSTDEIRKRAAAKGMLTLRESAIICLKSGATTLEEVVRVTTGE